MKSYDEYKTLLKSFSKDRQARIFLSDIKGPLSNLTLAIILIEEFQKNFDEPTRDVKKLLDVIISSAEQLRTIIDVYDDVVSSVSEDDQ